jgi:hypothetical protein
MCVALAVPVSSSATTPQPPPFPMLRAYAHKLVLERWHSEAEYRAFEKVIDNESGFNPCAYYPHSRDCRYAGSNSCGIPQANPCPSSWRGRLWAARWAQVRWTVAYMAGRYGSPSATWAHWIRNRSY